jgi:hypothetical protein
MKSTLMPSNDFSVALRLAALLALAFGSNLGIAQTPIAHWTFDEGLNNYNLSTVPDIANGNDAVWQDFNEDMTPDLSGLAYGAGIIGGAVHMAGGTDQFFRIAAVPQIDGITPTPDFGEGDPVLGVGVTWSAWIYLDADNTDGFNTIFGSREVEDVESAAGQTTNNNWNMTWDGANRRIDSRIGDQGSPTAGGTAVALSDVGSVERDQWHNLVTVWGNVGNTDGGGFQLPSLRLYIDGALVRDIPDTKVYELVSSGSWRIGDDVCCSNREFDGLLDDYAIFASALSTAEVQTLYNNGLNGINAAGTSTDTLLPGDVDGGGVSMSDFEIIRSNLTRSVTARNLGDLNGNREVDLDDFQEWFDHASPEFQAQALVELGLAVPEPSALVLVGLTLAPALFGRRKKRKC